MKDLFQEGILNKEVIIYFEMALYQYLLALESLTNYPFFDKIDVWDMSNPYISFYQTLMKRNFKRFSAF